MVALLLCTLLLQDAEEARRAVEKTATASYAYRVAGRFERSGEFFPPRALVARIGVFQAVRNGEKMLVKGPEGLWKTPEERIGEATERQQKDVADMMKTLSEAQPPHRMAAELLDGASKVVRGAETDLDGARCRAFHLSFPEKRIRDELEEQMQLSVKRGAMDKPDEVVWSSVKGAAQLFVRSSDGVLVRLAEQSSVKILYRKDPEQRPDEKRYELKLTMNLSDFGSAKLDLPVEVKERLGLKE